MLFLWRQKLSTDVWDCLWRAFPELRTLRIVCRGPGLGTKDERRPRTLRGLNADCASPAPSGPLPWSACLSRTVGSSSGLAISFPFSPRALKTMCCKLVSWAALGVVGGMGVASRSCATQRLLFLHTDPELHICELAAHITSFF